MWFLQKKITWAACRQNSSRQKLNASIAAVPETNFPGQKLKKLHHQSWGVLSKAADYRPANLLNANAATVFSCKFSEIVQTAETEHR